MCISSSAHHLDAPHTTVSPVHQSSIIDGIKSCCVLVNTPAVPGAPGCFNMGVPSMPPATSSQGSCELPESMLRCCSGGFYSKIHSLFVNSKWSLENVLFRDSIASFVSLFSPAFKYQQDYIQDDGDDCYDDFYFLASGHNSVTFFGVLSGGSASSGSFPDA